MVSYLGCVGAGQTQEDCDTTVLCIIQRAPASLTGCVRGWLWQDPTCGFDGSYYYAQMRTAADEGHTGFVRDLCDAGADKDNQGL